MKYLISLSAIALSFTLAGCSNKPLPPTEKIVKTTVVKADSGAELTINGYEQLKTDFHTPTDTSLRYIHRGHTSAAVAAETISFVLGAFAGGAQTNGFSKDELRGTAIETLSNPSVTYFVTEIEKSLQPGVADKKAGQLIKPLEIRPYIWMLVYENLSGGDNFELHYSVTISRDKDNQTEQPKIAYLECSPEPVKAPLAQWEANNYQKVNEVTHQLMEGCMLRFNDMKEQFLH